MHAYAIVKRGPDGRDRIIERFSSPAAAAQRLHLLDNPRELRAIPPGPPMYRICSLNADGGVGKTVYTIKKGMAWTF